MQFSSVKYIHILCNRTSFSSCKTETLYPLNYNFLFLPHRFLVITILLSVSMNLMTLGTSFKWNQTIFVLSCHAYFI